MTLRTYLVIICLLVAIMPVLPVSLAVNAMLNHSFGVSLNSEVEEALQSGLAVSRNYIDERRSGFEKSVGHMIDRVPFSVVDSASVARHFERVRVDASIHGVLVANMPTTITGETIFDTFTAQSDFAAHFDKSKLVQRSVGDGRVAFFETNDHSYQLALCALGRPRDATTVVLLYQQSDPQFLVHANRLLEGRRLVAQIRARQHKLSAVAFIPFAMIFLITAAVALTLAILMGKYLSMRFDALKQS